LRDFTDCLRTAAWSAPHDRIAQHLHYSAPAMKPAQLPPMRVESSVRLEIESAPREGESLSEIVEAAVLEAARRRRAQDEFVARGRASIAQARITGQHHDLDAVLDNMQQRLAP
jgi:hypothetical protein